MKRTAFAFASCALTLGLPAVAQAATAVYPGCAVPALKAGHHTFYVDPAKGSAAGDGSAAKPWKTLAEVLVPDGKLLSTQVHKKVGGVDPLSSANPNGPIKAGDVIMLMSGNHGVVTVRNAFNTDFVTVMAAPGQTPVISQLFMMSAANWAFQGIKFQGEDPASVSPPVNIANRDGANMISLGGGEWQGTSSNIVFTGDTFSTTDDVSAWSAKDWLLKPYRTTMQIKSPTCTSVTASRFYNVLDALYIGADKALVQGNTFEKFANDGIDTAASDVIIKSNTIRDNVSPSAINPWHPDGIQGWSKIGSSGPIRNTNVMIDSNTVIKTGDPDTSWMQGISIFDGLWQGLTIQNNVVVANGFHGISVYGASGLRILNNTVVASAPSKQVSWIRVDPMKGGTHSQDVIVRNNTAPTLYMNDTNITYDHNVIGGNYTALVSSKLIGINQTNTALSNIIIPTLTSQFVTLDNVKGAYDLRLRSGSNLIGAGSSLLAPTLDNAGKTRAKPTDIGAYTH
ncbi:right-handed parallel beta-helix repeat-containing protein [Lichenihabitans sp. Uapishka_5]|uniref:right-handed parallel beta-helix repeat-containing protein n=1 Tax=Lichenihabitans sp. Uapishka_5 TaxID=3037302 RepID=UPI0029E81D23|nr:right-handed parallel beta-helix repeat-containing protein [Lichenihabitans sp. Uapishka_5]MDX7952328.1 right-handed parallel beta-helix repeat-containing protein [Lichenihabitans sp. Uapishka_5]